MIIVETLKDGRERRFSDTGVMLRQAETGNLYEEAIDAAPVRFNYEETDAPIPDEDVEETELLEILMGGAT